MGRLPDFHEPIDGDFEGILTAIANEQKPKTGFTARPFIKWVGGKRSILPELLKRVPNEFDAYHEPFIGGGALFFALQPNEAYLADVNFHLVITYKVVRDSVDDLIRQLKIHERLHNKEYYLKARTKLFKEKEAVKIAALFIYLNKTCFNGLYRVNASGGFNVPMGDYKNPLICDEENLHNCSKVLKDVDIEQHGFSQEEIFKKDFYSLENLSFKLDKTCQSNDTIYLNTMMFRQNELRQLPESYFLNIAQTDNCF